MTLEAVAKSRRAGISGPDDPWKTEHYVNRIADYFGSEADVANAILDAVAHAGELGISVDELLNSLATSLGRSTDRHVLLRLVDRLRLDHYVDFDERNHLSFCFRIVRDSWLARRSR
jgi:hypothetical protein